MRPSSFWRHGVAFPSTLRIPLLLASFTLALIGPAPSAQAVSAPVTIEIESPQPGETVKNKVDLARVRGTAHSGSGEPNDFDVLIAIDVSNSTRYPSGIDVDEDEEVGFNPQAELVLPGEFPEDMVCTDPGDTILAAEIRASNLLLEALSAGRTRVGVLTFSGEVDPATGKRVRFDQQDARVEVALTADFDQVRTALGAILERGPSGATNFAAAIQLSVVELAGLYGARSSSREGAKRVVLFLTDGIPTFPIGASNIEDHGDIEAAISAARLARKAGIVINTYALGRYALSEPFAVTEMARLTVGSFTPVRNPGEIVGFLQGISFANIDDVVITNLTTNEVSYDVSLAPDGSFSGFVPVNIGQNRVLVTALASDGGETTIELALDFEKSGLNDRELAIELERIKKRNKEMLLLLERKRIQSFRARQRKRVVIEADE
jgi:hypothetical protein